jgi:hypothetical protein
VEIGTVPRLGAPGLQKGGGSGDVLTGARM